MRETATPATLADATLTRVEKGVNARHGAVVIGGSLLDANGVDEGAVRDWLSRHPMPAAGFDRIDRADRLFPMRVPLCADGAGPVGWLMLGPRPDGSFFGREERAVLLEVADPVGRALAIALEREQRMKERDDRDRQLGDEMSTLRGLLDRVLRHLGLNTDALPSDAPR